MHCLLIQLYDVFILHICSYDSAEKIVYGLRRKFLRTRRQLFVKWRTLSASKRKEDRDQKPEKAQSLPTYVMVKKGQALRNKIIQEKYDNGDPLTTKTTTSRYVVCLWKFIRNMQPNLKTRVDIKVGNRMTTSFCGVNWLGNGSLKQLYPDIFNPNNPKEAIIGEVWLNRGCRCTFRRLQNERQIDEILQYPGIIQEGKQF